MALKLPKATDELACWREDMLEGEASEPHTPPNPRYVEI